MIESRLSLSDIYEQHSIFIYEILSFLHLLHPRLYLTHQLLYLVLPVLAVVVLEIELLCHQILQNRNVQQMT